MSRLVRAEPRRWTDVYLRLVRAATIGAGSTILILQEESLAALFHADPESVAELVECTGRHAYHALALLRDPALALQFAARPQEFNGRICRMAAATGLRARETLQACDTPALRALLEAYPDAVVRLVELAGESAPAALAVLSDGPLRAAFERNPTETVTVFGRLAKSAGPLGEGVWQLTRSDRLGALLLAEPEKMLELVRRLQREMEGYGADACVALGSGALGCWLAVEPDACLATLREMSSVAGIDTPELMGLLAVEAVSEALVADPTAWIAAVRRIAGAAGIRADEAFTALAMPNTAALLVEHREHCLRLADGTERAAGAAFAALGNLLLAEAFRKNAPELVDDLLHIRRVSEDQAAAVYELLAEEATARGFLADRGRFRYGVSLLCQELGDDKGAALLALRSPRLAETFIKDPRRVVHRLWRIARRAGNEAPAALEILAEPWLAEIFDTAPDRLEEWTSRIVRDARPGAGDAFRGLADERGRNLWRTDKRIYLRVAAVFRQMTPVAAELLTNPAVAPLLRRVLEAETPPTSTALFGLLFSLRAVRSDPRLAENSAELATLCRRLAPGDIPALPFGYFTDLVAGEKTMDDKVHRLKHMARVFADLNLENFHRYSPEILENVYGSVTRPPESNGRLGMVMVGRNDPREAFAEDTRTYHSLLERGYDLIICESETDRELAERLRNGGVLAGSPLARTRRLDLLIIGGHGTADAINLGEGYGKQFDLDLSDHGWLEELPWLEQLRPEAAVLLFSCFTGAEDGGAPRKYAPPANRFGNMMEMMAALTGRTVFAPRVATGIGWLEFDSSRRVSQVHYWDMAVGNQSRPR
jgi:hypothetical protein